MSQPRPGGQRVRGTREIGDNPVAPVDRVEPRRDPTRRGDELTVGRTEQAIDRLVVAVTCDDELPALWYDGDRAPANVAGEGRQPARQEEPRGFVAVVRRDMPDWISDGRIVALHAVVRLQPREVLDRTAKRGVERDVPAGESVGANEGRRGGIIHRETGTQKREEWPARQIRRPPSGVRHQQPRLDADGAKQRHQARRGDRPAALGRVLMLVRGAREIRDSLSPLLGQHIAGLVEHVEEGETLLPRGRGEDQREPSRIVVDLGEIEALANDGFGLTGEEASRIDAG